MRQFLLVLLLVVTTSPTVIAKTDKKAEKKEEPKPALSSSTLSGLTLRSLGPALTSGRIGDLAIHPADPDTFFVAVASGGLWKTSNHGVSWTPVFDGEGSYSIGCVVIDPKDPNVVWVGTGENNAQRSVSYGDGLYKSLDGGKSWSRVGLEKSEHIGKIVIDPRDSNVVYVAAQGPLWAAGGDRGLYKTIDGGKTWAKILDISENTGVSDVVMDPRNPDVLIASAWQRRRHVWTAIQGGPDGGLHKTVDGGKTWRKLAGGLPSGDVGRIGLDWSTKDPSALYAVVDAAEKAGFYRSTNAGESWVKRSDYRPGGAQYYQEIFVDPNDSERIYSMDVYLKVSEDGGGTFKNVPERSKHIDNHVIWINPNNSSHLINGNDGGLYESWDRGETWDFFANLPITQFYRVAVSNDRPFYYIYGGTQDNFTLGGPSRTTNSAGIPNSDWFITVGGDGFEPAIDPENPQIVYSQSQYGNLQRFDRQSGEIVDIMPQPGPDDAPLRWNWDSPVLISPHKATRLYFAAQRVFRSEDRGDSWTPVSGDLTRQTDRNALPVMGKVWPLEAIGKNRSTSPYGNIISFDESPKVEGLLYAGTDDGLIQVSEDGGANWRKVESFPGVPGRAFVSVVKASQHEADTLFAGFNNHKDGDFKPYLLKSTDRGKTWTSIAADLPERGSVWTIAHDHVDPDLLFVGTEFGLFTSVDGGKKWLKLDGGLPIIAVRDLDIQRRENDLVLATFGRGFYVLDDYSPLRTLDEKSAELPFQSFAVKEALAYNFRYPLGIRFKGFMGDDYYVAENPPFGAIFTYHLMEERKSLKDLRKEREKKVAEDKGEMKMPSWDELRAESIEDAPEILITVKDAAGREVRRLSGPVKAGVHRIAWDLRYPAPHPVSLEEPDLSNWFASVPQGPQVVPGEYTVSFAESVNGQITDLGQSQRFRVTPLGAVTLPATDKAELLTFQQKTADLQRAVFGASESLGETKGRLDLVEKAVEETPALDPSWRVKVASLAKKLSEIEIALEGDRIKGRFEEPTLPGVAERVGRIVDGHWTASSAPTKTQRDAYEVAARQFEKVLVDLKEALEVDLAAIEKALDAAGAAYTPGRLPVWRR